MKKKFVLWLALVVVVSFLWSGRFEAASATLKWGANTEIDLAGYELHYGESSGNYIIVIVVPKTLTTYTVGGLEEGKEYFFANKAFDTSGNLSDLSEEVSKQIPISDKTPPSQPTEINITPGSSLNINIGQ